MFTGIIEEVGKVISADSGKLVIAASTTLEGMQLGDSIAVNGACLTITSLDAKSFSVDIMPETIRQTNLGILTSGDEVNLERPLTLSGKLGGHLVQGHVDDTGRLAQVKPEEEALIMKFEAPPELMRYIAKRGFIAVDGISLTVIDYDKSSFQVSIVEYTREHTALGKRKVGDLVNLEVDIIAKYVERLTQAQSEGVTIDFLKEHGFLAN